jgi:hypothetical protein
MTHDPMRQADVARRLSNLAKARRCGAKTRAGHPCRQAAVRNLSPTRVVGNYVRCRPLLRRRELRPNPL